MAAIAVVRKLDRFVQRLVVNVVQAPSSRRSRLDGSGESARDQAGNEVTAVGNINITFGDFADPQS